ncbi:MAG TPA: M48 family metallopeptidase [Candidatus Krumholzibacteria bacterium]|nr:M48 family metallopeptidase [Candidatus Krumholzibacteria bacterium]
MKPATLLLAAFLAVLASTLLLRWLNLRHLRRHGSHVPPELEGVVEPERLERIARYTVERSRLGTVELAVENIVLGIFLFGGGLGAFDGWVAAHAPSFLGGGMLFFFLLFLAASVLRIPFELVEHFQVEKRFGFNRMSTRLWLSDQVKSLLLGLAIGGLLVGGALVLVRWSPTWWWLWVWTFFLVVSVFLLYLSPVLIEPLFFKFEPLRVAGLEDAIRELLGRAGLVARRVFQVDASRRSTHSNAYFTGLGRVKRIVLFDTLLQQMEPAEILAVLAHEAGHWKLRHVLQRLVVTEALVLAVLYAAWLSLGAEWIPALVGLEQASFYSRALLLAVLGSLLAFPLTPLGSALSRRHEWQADRFAVALTRQPQDLASALAKLARENLQNLHPHPLYATFYFSHPPVVERLRRLQATS